MDASANTGWILELTLEKLIKLKYIGGVNQWGLKKTLAILPLAILLAIYFVILVTAVAASAEKA